MTTVGSSRRVVIAPDSFKGTVSALDAAQAIARGWATVSPQDDLCLVPMADGGEGSVDAIAAAHRHAVRKPVAVTGPDGRQVQTTWLSYDEAEVRVGVVELASTSGIMLLDPLLPYDAHTLGFGEAIAAALDAGVDRLVLAIGGSSSTDAGTGLLCALGARLLDADGHEIRLGNRGLESLSVVDLSGMSELPRNGAMVITDVTSPLLGLTGAAHVFGEQKGASAHDRMRLDAAVAHAASLLGGDPNIPGAGAAGGAGYALALWGATLAPGAQAIGSVLGLESIIANADVVLTGEGRFDAQSAAGKVPSYVNGLASKVGARTALIAGSIAMGVGDVDSANGFDRLRSLSDLAGGVPQAMERPERWLIQAGAELAAEFSN